MAGTLATVLRAVSAGRHAFQGHVLTSGDLLASWAVENAVHHLDLLVEAPPPPTALGVVRRTAEALLDERLPAAWDDTTAALVATGRVAPPDGASHLSDRLPVLG